MNAGDERDHAEERSNAELLRDVDTFGPRELAELVRRVEAVDGECQACGHDWLLHYGPREPGDPYPRPGGSCMSARPGGVVGRDCSCVAFAFDAAGVAESYPFDVIRSIELSVSPPDPLTAAHDFPADAFPFLVEFFAAGGETVHSITVSGPGGVVIPPLAEKYGPVTVRITYANGETDEGGPA